MYVRTTSTPQATNTFVWLASLVSSLNTGPNSDYWEWDALHCLNQCFHVSKTSQCYNVLTGVPISIQWSPDGYHYPIQISQYGLSHYSKYLREDPPHILILMDGSDQYMKQWLLPDTKSRVNIVKNAEKGWNVVEFATSGMYCDIFNFHNHISLLQSLNIVSLF